MAPTTTTVRYLYSVSTEVENPQPTNSAAVFSSTNLTLHYMVDNNNNTSSFTVSEEFQLGITVLLILIVVLGLLGNGLVIFTLLFTRAHRQTTTSAFVLNLSIADLLFLIFCVPFQGTLYLLNSWPFGLAICKIAHFCQYATAYASAWLLTVMSIDRYAAIGHPLKSVNWRNPNQALKISLFVWIVSSAVSVPWFWLYESFLYEDGRTTACYPVWPDLLFDNKHWIWLIIFVTSFALPSIIIIVMALLVAGTLALTVAQPLLSDTTPGGHRALNKKRRRVAWLVFALSLVFFVCWLPHNISVVWMNFGQPNYDAHFYIYKIVSHVFTYLNSCVNPLLYSLGSGQFRTKLVGALMGRRNHNQQAMMNTQLQQQLLSQASTFRPPTLSFNRCTSLAGVSQGNAAGGVDNRKNSDRTNQYSYNNRRPFGSLNNNELLIGRSML